MRLSPIITRLRSEVPGLKLVGGAAEFARAVDGLTTWPAAFVLPARELATPSPFMDQLVEQVVGNEFAVLIATRNLADDEGAAAVDSLWALRVAVRAKLLGWVPDDAEHGCEFAGGEFLDFKDAVLWWQDTYRSGYVIRSV